MPRSLDVHDFDDRRVADAVQGHDRITLRGEVKHREENGLVTCYSLAKHTSIIKQEARILFAPHSASLPLSFCAKDKLLLFTTQQVKVTQKNELKGVCLSLTRAQ